jgi:hypothetical protein
MDSLSPEVYAALVLTNYQTYSEHPQTGAAIPCISYREGENRDYGRADGVEYVTLVEYLIDAWAYTPEDTATMALAIDTKMAELGLRRTFSHDLYEADTRIHHKTMRYRGLIHIAQQKIYQ